jgi:hypothetical protein
MEVQVNTISDLFIFNNSIKKKKIPLQAGQALRDQGAFGFQIARQSACEGGRVVSPTYRTPLQPRKYSCYFFLPQAESPQGHSAARRIVNKKSHNTEIIGFLKITPHFSLQE